MPNWCSNRVEFQGEPDQIEILKMLFQAMAQKEKKERKGQLPQFVRGTGYLFDISWNEGVLYYETKWSPNVEVMVKVAEHFKVGFTMGYAEPGNSVFGEAAYQDGKLTDTFLDNEDYDLIGQEEGTDRYIFENGSYECREEILDILLERKKQIDSIKESLRNS